MPDMTEWTPVTDAAGETLGWMAPADPDEPDAGWFEADRLPRIRRRAAVLDPVAELAADEAFAADEVIEMGRAAGLSGDDLDAAANVAWLLWCIERRYPE